jgi:CheY-like chemotaxis protein
MWPGKKRILVVDDEADITLTLFSVLQESGFDVAFSNDPLLALQSFKPHYYDLLILDIKMPEMNGFELYTEMRKIDNQAKFCFITAGEMYYDKVRKDEEQYCKLDTERFLQKPISNVDLVKIIEKIMMLNNSPNIQNA